MRKKRKIFNVNPKFKCNKYIKVITLKYKYKVIMTAVF